MADFTGLHKVTKRVEDVIIDLDMARSSRDDEIRRLHASGVSKYRLAKEVGISEQAITKIIDKES